MFRPVLTRLRFLLPLITAAVGAAVIASTLRSPLSTVRADAIHLARQGEEIHPLVLGRQIEREISGGTRHIYKVSLSAGQFFRATIQQKGVDVIVLLHDSTGKKLDEFSEPVYENRERSVLFIAPSDDDYHLLVRPRLKEAPVGRYQITVNVVRPATESDQIRARASQLMKDTSQALARVPPPSVEETAKMAGQFEEALSLWRGLGDSLKIGESLLNLGIVNTRIGEYSKSLAFFEQAIPYFPQTAEGSSFAATALNDMANVYLTLGETRKALEIFLKSLELKKEEGRSRAITLDNIGTAYTFLGEYQLALDHHLQALSSFRALGRRRDESTTLNNIAWLYESIGDPEKAIEYMLQALPLVKAVEDKAAEALYLSNVGSFYLSLGEPRRALEYANQSLDLSRAINNRRTESGSLTLLCKVYPALGEFEKGLDACNRALVTGQSSRDTIHKATILTALSRIYEQTGERQKASKSREDALGVYRAIGDPTGEGAALHALGQYALDGGDLTTARERIERAIEIVESQRVKVGSHQLRTTYMAGRRQVYETYIDLLMQLRLREPEKGYERIALKVSERARARGLLDLLVDARARIRQGADVTLLEEERRLLERLNDKDVAWKQLRNSERTKNQAEIIVREINELTLRLQSLEAKIRASSPRYAELTQPRSLTHEEIQHRLLDENTVLLEYSLGENRSWLWAVSSTEILTHQLPARQEIEVATRRVYELLIARQPKVGEIETERQARVADADEKFSHEAGALSRMLLDPIAAKLRQEWKGKRLLIVAGGALEYLPFAVLPAPELGLEGDGATGRQGDGANGRETSFRPVALSPRRPVPLIVDHEIVNLPSASVLAELRRDSAGRRPASKALVVIADPVFGPDDPRVLTAARKKRARGNLAVNVRSAGDASAISPLAADPILMRAAGSFNRTGFSRLPFSREEADEIAKFVPKSSLLKATDFQANRAIAASGELSRYRILHFATHGLLNSDRPELSGLVLSLVDENGKSQDGFLRTHEIFNLELLADVVVLSACQTALGKEIKGEGLVGLTRGFMYAGAARVVASLWQVDDFATAELMKRFYRAMLRDGMRPAAALRAAQIDLMKQSHWAAPYFWAGFVLQGEYK